MLKNPENYYKILVRPHGPLPRIGEKDRREWAVAGVTRYEPIGMYNKPIGVVEYIQTGFKNEQVAEAWMKAYLDRYVKLHMLGSFPLDDSADYEPVDESKTVR